MEIFRVIVLIGFLLFCSQIICKRISLKKQGTLVSGFKFNLKTIISTVLLLAFFVIFVSELLFQAFQTSFSVLPDFLRVYFHHSSIVVLFGSLILILSVVSMHFTLKALTSSLRFGLNANNLGELITSGIFARSRNPFFVSILLLFLGISMVFPTPFFIGILILSLLSIHFVILKEEKFMLESYGEEYREYFRKVRRYF